MYRIQILLASIVCAFATTPIQQLASGNQKVSANLYKGLAKTSTGDLILCPVSAEIVLALVTEGAVGPTKTELIDVLGLPPNDAERRSAFNQLTNDLNQNSSSKLLSANRIYLSPTFQIESDFRNVAVTDYKAGIQNINFGDSSAAADTINRWVEDHTNNKIQNLIAPDKLSSATKMVLVNTMYLKSNWAIPFKKQLTQPGPFHFSSTESKPTDLMHAENFYRYKYCSSLRAKFLELDFEDRRISMTFVLPDDIDGLGALENQLEDVLAVNVNDSERVALTLPRFMIQSSINLKPILEQDGLKRVFDATEANLTGISHTGGLFVDFVIQKAWINVTESGVEAAAATAAGISLTSVIIEPPRITFTADHPFVFYIRERKTGLVLFVGRFIK